VSNSFHPVAADLADLIAEDSVGYETLRRMASVSHYNRWIFEELSPFAGSHILEAGCGIGNMTAYFLDCELLVAIDRLQASVEFTRRRYHDFSNVRVLQGDISDPQLPAQLASWSFDTALCINVLEHVEDDLQALRHLWQILQPGGRLLLLVPAGRFMYGTLDQALGHYRRYERRQLNELVRQAGFQPLILHYMNLAGVPGWWLNSRVLKRRLLPEDQLRWFNRLAPLFIRSERMLRRVWDMPAGQSLVCIAQKRPDR
jgi:SAM-dependent methyltransferase